MLSEVKKNRYRTIFTVAAAAFSLFSGGIAQAKSPIRRVVLESGTVIPVRLDRALSSKTTRTGDRFTATVRFGNDDAGMPEGTQIEGVVRESRRYEQGTPGVLDLDFRRMVTPGGQSRALFGSVVALNGKGIQRTNGLLISTADKNKDRLKFIGLGAGGGFLLGKLTKSNSTWSTILGAGAGYLYNEFANKPKPGDVSLKSGAEFGLRLDRQFTFDTNQPESDVRSTDELDRNESYTDNRGDAAAALDEIGMRIDDEDLKFGTARPFLRNGEVLVPLDTVSRAAGFSYRYNKNNRVVSTRNGAMRLPLDSRYAVMNGKRYTLPVAGEMRDDTVYVPLQFLNLTTGGTALWDADSRTIHLTTNRRR